MRDNYVSLQSMIHRYISHFSFVHVDDAWFSLSYFFLKNINKEYNKSFNEKKGRRSMQFWHSHLSNIVARIVINYIDKLE